MPVSQPATIDALLRTSAQRHADRPALTLETADQGVSYRGLDAAVERLAWRLSADVAPGQRVAIVAPNWPALVVGMFATWRLGGVAVPLNARYREWELRGILQDAEAVVVVSVGSYRGYSFRDLLPALLPQLPTLRRGLFVDAMGGIEEEWPAGAGGPTTPQPLDPEIGVILYTSGTTGAPKGALVKHLAEIAGARATNDVLGTTPEDRSILVVPLSHAFGLMCLVAALAAGSHAVLVESTFSPEPMARAIERHGATILHGSPTLFAQFLKWHRAAATPPRTLRSGLVAGAPCPPQLLEGLDAAGLPILNLYGMTEIGNAACCRLDDPPRLRYTTVGRPLPGYQFRIAGGEVQVRGPYVTPGYYRKPEQTAAAFAGEWLRTGDLGSLDEDGYLSIAGRVKDVVQVAGLNVFPAEVEGCLLTHPDVAQAVVVGVPHDTLGEVLQAFVVARPGSDLTPPALLQFARARIAGYKLPYAIRLLPELPALATGKPDRVALTRSAVPVEGRGLED